MPPLIYRMIPILPLTFPIAPIPEPPFTETFIKLSTLFFECTHSREEGPLLPTFRRKSSQSTIDYLYASPFFYQHLHSSDIVYLSSEWTDHALLRARFVFSSDRQGPGIWRANPLLAKNQYCIHALYTELDNFFNDLSLATNVDMTASVPISSPPGQLGLSEISG